MHVTPITGKTLEVGFDEAKKKEYLTVSFSQREANIYMDCKRIDDVFGAVVKIVLQLYNKKGIRIELIGALKVDVKSGAIIDVCPVDNEPFVGIKAPPNSPANSEEKWLDKAAPRLRWDE